MPEAASLRTLERRDWALIAGVFLLLFGITLATAADYGLTWDEPYYMTSQGWQREWFADFRAQPIAALAAPALEQGWNRDPYHIPHPPFSRLVSNLLGGALEPLLGPIVAYRASNTLFFAGTGALLCLLMTPYGHGWALLAVALWAAVPRVFAHAHFLTTDTPITFFAVAMAVAWLRTSSHRLRIALIAVLLGAAVATKFTAFLLPLPFLIWLVATRRWPDLGRFILAGLLSLVVAWLLVPFWWHAPISGPLEFIRTSMSRESHTAVSILLFGQTYDFRAPWYTAWVTAAVALPLSFWLPAALGAITGLRHWRSEVGLITLSALLPIAVTMLPNAPKHDGVRLFLHGLPFLSLLAVFGLRWLRQKIVIPSPTLDWISGVGVGVLLVASQAISVLAYHPLQLSYYNRLVGGLAGAEARGLEVTYWMDAYTPSFLAQLNTLLPPNAHVRVVVGDPYYFQFLQALGRLRPDLRFDASPAPFLLALKRYSVLGEAQHLLKNYPVLIESELDGIALATLYRTDFAVAPTNHGPTDGSSR